MNGRKLAAFALSGVMAVGLTACGGNGEPNESPAGGSGGEAYLVGICQLAPHDALDAATRGFKAALVEAFGEDGVKFDEQNAGGEYNNCATIVDGFVSENVDLMLANATYSLQAAQSATADIPILGTAITNYGIALGLDSTEDKVLGGNISGTSDLAPLDQQAAMLQELFPDAENVGLLYCSAEPNSVFQVETIQGYLEEMGYTCTQYGVGLGVATLSISYEELGRITGEMAVQILTGEADVSELAIQYDTAVTKMYNAANCEALGITVPDGYQPIE